MQAKGRERSSTLVSSRPIADLAFRLVAAVCRFSFQVPGDDVVRIPEWNREEPGPGVLPVIKAVCSAE